MAAEKAAEKIISLVQPTSVSEETRKKVTHYIQRLLTGLLGCQVFSYGSVPLKTYLPDGDIDLTAFGGASVEDSFANDMVSVLEGEDKNKDAEFVVKDVQIIRAEVKLVKCMVQNIVVDISINQIGGLCTLCFLEQVDRLIGRDHLFKRSIILIKAWCYYESRILGSHHGLISTYALETLVLYIFHLFHSTLSGPLAVLYKFLDYFSKFDWDNYCVSLTGPVHISSLPEIVVQAPESGRGDLLLSNDFLRYCEMFSVPSKVGDINPRTFPPKHLNIVDPLKENNNLGRSISKGNFYRIKSAFTYGAQQLERILVQPENNIADELFNFFSNTLDRHGSGQRRDVQDHGLGGAFSVSETVSFQEKNVVSESILPHSIVTPGDFEHDPEESQQDGLSNSIASGAEREFSGASDEKNIVQGRVGHCSPRNAEDLATSKVSDDLSKISLRSDEASVSPLGIAHHTPHLYSSNSVLGNRMVKYGNSDTQQSENYENKVSSVRRCESLNSWSDLGGDYDTHLRCLQFGRWCYKFASGGPSLSMTPPPPPPPPPFPIPPSHFRIMNTWDAIQRSSQFRRIGFRVPGPLFYPMNSQLIPSVTFGLEEMPKPRGTGTYFPSTNWHPQNYRSSAMIGRNQAPASYRNSGQHTTSNEFPVHGMNGSSDIHQRRVNPYVNGLSLQPGGVAEFGSVKHIPLEAPLQRPASSISQTSNQGLPTMEMQRPKPIVIMNQDRSTRKTSYRLKDDKDFPPLSA